MFKVVPMIIYKVPSFLAVCQKFFYILLLEYFSPSWIPQELIVSHLLHRLNYASSNHLANNHTVQGQMNMVDMALY